MIIIIGTAFKKIGGIRMRRIERTVRLGVRTPLFHSGNTGSIPVRCTIGIKIKREYILVTLFLMIREYPNIFIKRYLWVKIGAIRVSPLFVRT